MVSCHSISTRERHDITIKNDSKSDCTCGRKITIKEEFSRKENSTKSSVEMLMMSTDKISNGEHKIVLACTGVGDKFLVKKEFSVGRSLKRLEGVFGCGIKFLGNVMGRRTIPVHTFIMFGLPRQ